MTERFGHIDFPNHALYSVTEPFGQ